MRANYQSCIFGNSHTICLHLINKLSRPCSPISHSQHSGGTAYIRPHLANLTHSTISTPTISGDCACRSINFSIFFVGKGQVGFLLRRSGHRTYSIHRIIHISDRMKTPCESNIHHHYGYLFDQIVVIFNLYITHTAFVSTQDFLHPTTPYSLRGHMTHSAIWFLT